LFYRRGMTSIPRLPTVAFATIAAVFLLAVSGCTPEQSSAPTAAGSTHEAPLFATDEKALEAARVTYATFIDTANQIMVEGGSSPERIDEIATPEVAKVEKDGFQSLVERKLIISGKSIVRDSVLQSYYPRSTDGARVVSAYFCVDVSGVSLVDEDGTSVVKSTRPDMSTFETEFDLASDSPTGLKVAANDPWGGEGIC
jgi:hypothetical protein